jgi:hypothetical protein
MEKVKRRWAKLFLLYSEVSEAFKMVDIEMNFVILPLM